MAPDFLSALVFATLVPFQFKFRPPSPISWKGGGCCTQANPELLSCSLCSLKVTVFIKLAGLALQPRLLVYYTRDELCAPSGFDALGGIVLSAALPRVRAQDLKAVGSLRIKSLSYRQLDLIWFNTPPLSLYIKQLP